MRQSFVSLVRAAASVATGPVKPVKRLREPNEKKVFVSGLHWITGKPQIRETFETFGRVREIVLPINWKLGINQGYGFVLFDDAASAKKAAAARHLRLDDKNLFVRFIR